MLTHNASGSILVTLNLRYDALGRVTRRDQVLGASTFSTQATYDGLDRVTTLTYPNGAVVTHEYNGPWLKRVYECPSPAPTIRYALYEGYNALGQPGTLTFGNDVVTTATYAQASNPTCTAITFRLCTLVTAKGGTTYQNLTYGYDAGGNVTVITDPLQGTQTYGYDGLDRLTSATGPYGTQTYAYSPIGNLTQNPLLGPYTYPGIASPSGRLLPHAVKNTGGGQPDFTYDDNGNLTTGAGRTLTYDLENRPTRCGPWETVDGSIFGETQKDNGEMVTDLFSDGRSTHQLRWWGRLPSAQKP